MAIWKILKCDLWHPQHCFDQVCSSTSLTWRKCSRSQPTIFGIDLTTTLPTKPCWTTTTVASGTTTTTTWGTTPAAEPTTTLTKASYKPIQTKVFHLCCWQLVTCNWLNQFVLIAERSDLRNFLGCNDPCQNKHPQEWWIHLGRLITSRWVGCFKPV